MACALVGVALLVVGSALRATQDHNIRLLRATQRDRDFVADAVKKVLDLADVDAFRKHLRKEGILAYAQPPSERIAADIEAVIEQLDCNEAEAK